MANKCFFCWRSLRLAIFKSTMCEDHSTRGTAMQSPKSVSADSLTIAQICSSPSWGGMEMHVAELAFLLRNNGCQVQAFCAPQSRLTTRLQDQAIEPKVFRPHGYIDPCGIWSLFRAFTKDPVDVVHVHYSKDLWSLIPALQLLPENRRPAVVLSKHIGTQKRKTDLFHRRLYARVARVIAISRVIERNILQTHPVQPQQVVVLHHGIDTDRFQRSETVRNRKRAELGLAASEILIGTIGRLESGKGHLEFLAMAEQLASEFDQVRFVMIGEATRGEEFRAEPILEKARTLNLADRLQLLGFRDDVPELLSAMDIFAFPSHAEAFGLVLIEAMAASLPVVSSRCDGVLDIVQEGKNGLLVPPHDSAALTQAVRSLVVDPELRSTMGKNSRKIAEHHFSTKRMMTELLQLYHQCLAEAAL